MTKLLPITLAAFTLAAAPQRTARAQTASAQRAKPTAAQKALVLRHFEAGEAAKARGEYLTAASEYLAGYAVFPSPPLLYNAGEVYRLAGDAGRALECFTKYVAADPHGPGAASALLAIKELSVALAAEQSERVRIEEEQAKRLAEEQAKPLPARPSSEPAEPMAISTPVERGSPENGRSLRVAGIAVTAASLAAFGFSVGFGIHAKNLSNEASSLSPSDPNYEERIRDLDQRGEAADRNLLISAGIGVVALGTGITLYVLGRRAGAETQIALTVVTPSSLALGASLRF